SAKPRARARQGQSRVRVVVRRLWIARKRRTRAGARALGVAGPRARGLRISAMARVRGDASWRELAVARPPRRSGRRRPVRVENRLARRLRVRRGGQRSGCRSHRARPGLDRGCAARLSAGVRNLHSNRSGIRGRKNARGARRGVRGERTEGTMRDFAIELTDRPGELGRVATALSRYGVNLKAVTGLALDGHVLVRIIAD